MTLKKQERSIYHTQVNVQPRTQYDSQEAGKIIYHTQVNVQPRTQYERKIIYHTQTCACTEQSINMITDDVNGVSVSMVTVHVV